MESQARREHRYLLTAASAVVVIAGLRAAAPLILPILLAGFLTILSLPLLRWLRERGAPVTVAVALTLSASLAVLGVMSLLVSLAVADAGASAPAYLQQLREGAARARDLLLESPLSDYISPEQLDPASQVDVLIGSAGGVIKGTVVGLASLVSHSLLITLALGFMLAEACVLGDKLQRIREVLSVDAEQFREVTVEMQHYLGIKTAVSLATGFLIFLTTWLCGVDFPLFWGLLAFVLNYIPTIGSIIAAVPAVLLAIVQHGAGVAAIVAVGYLAVNMLLGNILEPRLLGLRFRLSTLMVFVSLLFWGFVWGPLGMLLSVPLTRSILIVLEHTGDYHWLTVLLGRAR